MARKVNRPTIPTSIKLQLWAQSAGRCEFRGCNKLLYKDHLTQKTSNLAQISHIVAFSPDGARGDPIRSKLLEKDITNLMLTCLDHGTLIDNKERVSEYPEELLLEFKREHEQRIRLLTDAKEDAKTLVMVLQVPIMGQNIQINTNKVFRAILPKYPAEEVPMNINLTGFTTPPSSDGFFELAAKCIKDEVQASLRKHRNAGQIHHLSVFAIAPVPLLIFFGSLLGDIEEVDLYQYHRDTQDWKWKEDISLLEYGSQTQGQQSFFKLECPAESTLSQGQEIGLLLSLSNTVKREEVEQTLGHTPLIYEIKCLEPNFDFLKTQHKLEIFGQEVRRVFEEIRKRHSHNCTVHVFAALPAPAAIELGRNIKPDYPALQLYQYNRENRSHLPVMKINTRTQGN